MSARLGELLVQRGLLQSEQLERARNNPRGQRSVEYAVRQGWCDDATVGRVVAEVCDVPFVDVSARRPEPELVRLVTLEQMRKHRLVPLELRGTVLVLAMADPTNVWAQDDVKFLSGHDLEVCAGGPVAIANAIEQAEENAQRAWYSYSLGHELRRTGVSGLHEWVVGRAFAFHPDSATLQFLRDGVVHELGAVATAHCSVLAPAAPTALFTDREVYGPGDPVRIGLLGGERRGQCVQVTLRSGTSLLPPLDVDLDANGLGWLSLPAPPPGTYQLACEGMSASFSVATYRLSPLQVRWRAERQRDAVLEGELHARMLGAPLEGTLVIALLDEASQPPRRVHAQRVRTDASGRATVHLPLRTRGAASLEVQVEGRAELTASVALAGLEKTAREPLALSQWGETWLASSLPFEGSSPLRGLHVGPGPGGGPAPLRIVEVTRGQALLELTRPVYRGQVVAVAVDGLPLVMSIRDGAPGLRLEVPLQGPWTLLMVGVLEPAEKGLQCWEGRAALLPPSFPLELDVPTTARPGEDVALTVRGNPGTSVWVSVRDARLTARGPAEVAAAALRRDLEATLMLLPDWSPRGTLEGFFPWRRHVSLDALAEEEAPVLAESADVDSAKEGAAPSLAEEPPAVVLCQQVLLDEAGVAHLGFQAPRLRGRLDVEVFGALRGDWANSHAAIAVHQPVHGELLLPRYLSEGERAVDTLHVALDSGEAEVEVRYEGTPLVLHTEGRSATRLRLSAPGAEVRFDALAGHFEAEVRADGGEVQRLGGRVEHPGRATWLERTVVALAPGERLDVEGARARALLGVEVQARRMTRALQDYRFSCSEQTSAILLACVTELLMGTDRRPEVIRHLSGAVERLEMMALPSGPFRAYPDADVNEWLSKAAAAHLLELESVKPGHLLKAVWPLLLRALTLGQRAAEAHGLELAPARPRTARQALACLRRNPERARELAGQVLAGVGTWEGGLGVLRLGPETAGAERLGFASEVRAETAYGAAVLLRAGPEFLSPAAPLVRTALDGLTDSGRCYSTLDSVAALALLASLPNAEEAARTCGVDGERLPIAEAARRRAHHSIEALDGALLVEVERPREEDLNTSLRGDLPGTVQLERANGKGQGPFLPGESLELVVRLDAGYHAGDLLQVFLPPALAWLRGGTQVRGFALDFEGQDVLRVPLVITSATVDASGRQVPQRCGVYLRNMYDARRGSAFDDLRLRVPSVV